MIMRDVAFLAGAVVRSQAYVQAMVKAGLYPAMCILYGGEREDFLRVRQKEDGEEPFFDTSESLLSTVEENRIPYVIIADKDVNSSVMAEYLREIPQRYIIYSGYGGSILKGHLFHIGKQFLHVHAGILPRFRGSTTAYYSLLQEGVIGATAILLSEKIDEGDMIVEVKHEVPGNRVDIDYVYEPWIRSQALIDALKQYMAERSLSGKCQGTDGAEIYYIIHPVLKHLAMLKAEKRQEAGDEAGHIFPAR